MDNCVIYYTDPPDLQIVPTLAEIDVFQNVSFRCQATATPPAIAYWLTSSLTSQVNVQTSQVDRDGSSMTIVDLLLVNAQPEDTGLIKCVAENTAGKVKAEGKLTVFCKWRKILIKLK